MSDKFCYAQLNDDNIVFAVTETVEKLESSDKLILIKDYDLSYLTKKWNGKTFEDVPLPPIRIIDTISFRNRFTKEELTSIYSSENVDIKIWLDDLRAKSYVHLDEENIDILVSEKVLTKTRKSEILK
jgi:hypothetical protein